MTDQAQPPARQDLVGLYAGRIQSRYQLPVDSIEQRRSGNGVQPFGRRPAVRQLGASRRRRALGALMATAMIAGSAPALASGSTYQIQAGDTLSGIADQHGISVEELARLNGIEDPDRIFAGDHLVLSESASTDQDTLEVGDTVYLIKEGDTLFEIAYRFGVDLNELLARNDITNANLIFAGDVLFLPTASDTAVGQHETDNGHPGADYDIVAMHLVARGETLSSIALRYGVPIERLAAVNGIENYDQISVGDLLNIPGAPISGPAEPVDETTSAESGVSESTMLSGMPIQQQSLALSCEAAAASIATAYWGFPVSEWVFIENLPSHPNPHHGFRGDMNGHFGGTDDYGVYAKPLAQILANYGFIGDEFYSFGDTSELKARVDAGQPVLVWMTSMASPQERFYDWHEGEGFTLVPQQHVVVVYGYDAGGVHVADPGDGQFRTFGWEEFVRSWSLFDGMSMAVYPKG